MIRTSVIIPVYNTAEYLEECIESVLSQTQKEIEIILIDDGSDDGSLEIARHYAERYPFIFLEQQEHLYQGTARNRGLRAARGEYVYFMDSDDAILPGLFEECYRACEEDKLDFVMFDAYGFRYDENDRELVVPDDIVDRRQMGIEDRLYNGPEFWNAFYNCHGILYVCWLLYIRRSYLMENRLFYEERTYFEDNDWMLRMYLNAERIRYLPKIFHRHRWRRGSNMLDGFTDGLLAGCFRMHQVLLDIHAAYEGDERRQRMAEDVIRLNVRRFDRLSESEPDAERIRLLSGFCDDLRMELAAETEGGYAYYVHLCAALHILRSAGTWKDASFCNAYRSLANASAILCLPPGKRGIRIGIYGTGVIGRCCAELLTEAGKEVGGSGKEAVPEDIFFIDTWKTGGEFCGFPLVNIRNVPALAPDCILIASTKYADEMERQAAEICKDPEKVIRVRREIQMLV